MKFVHIIAGYDACDSPTYSNADCYLNIENVFAFSFIKYCGKRAVSIAMNDRTARRYVTFDTDVFDSMLKK